MKRELSGTETSTLRTPRRHRWNHLGTGLLRRARQMGIYRGKRTRNRRPLRPKPGSRVHGFLARHPWSTLHAGVRNVHVPASSQHRPTTTRHAGRWCHAHRCCWYGSRLDSPSRLIDTSRQHVSRSNENHARNMGCVFLAHARWHGDSRVSDWACSLK